MTAFRHIPGFPRATGPPAGLMILIAAAICTARNESGTLLAIDRARKVLGFEPRHTWRNHLPENTEEPR